MSTPPSGQNVSTTSSVRPSSSAWVYEAIVIRTPASTSARVVLRGVTLDGGAYRLGDRRTDGPRDSELRAALPDGMHHAEPAGEAERDQPPDDPRPRRRVSPRRGR